MNTVETINSVVRPAVTLAFAAGVLWGFIVGSISGDTFMAIVSMVLGFWFRDRLETKGSESPKE
jgi:hypothetical protein